MAQSTRITPTVLLYFSIQASTAEHCPAPATVEENPWVSALIGSSGWKLEGTEMEKEDPSSAAVQLRRGVTAGNDYR